MPLIICPIAIRRHYARLVMIKGGR